MNHSKKRIMLLLCIAVILTILALLPIIKQKNFIKEYNVFDKLENTPGFLVNESEDLDTFNDVSFNLKSKSYFRSLETVKKGKTGYGLVLGKKPIDVYNRRVQAQIGVLKKLKTSNQELKDSNYRLEREILPLLDENEFTKEYSANFEALYLNVGLKKVKITFNKNYLPIRIDGYYENERGSYWEFLRHITYPYKTKLAFNKEMKEYIGYIKEVEEEKEAEWEAEVEPYQ